MPLAYRLQGAFFNCFGLIIFSHCAIIDKNQLKKSEIILYKKKNLRFKKIFSQLKYFRRLFFAVIFLVVMRVSLDKFDSA